MKKLIALLLALTATVASVVSCSAPKSAAELLDDADAALASAPYKMTMVMDFDCENDDLAAIFEATAGETVAYIDGENFSTQMLGMEMTVVDKVAYIKYEMEGVSVKYKQNLSEEELAEVGSSLKSFESEMFENVEMTTENGKTTLTCTALKADKVNEVIESVFGSLEGTEATISNISYVIVLNDGRYESATMEMSAEIEVMGFKTAFSCSVGSAFDYEAGKTITVPADADEYLSQ